MANPTTYFGWVMPNSADLVTDLPADFNVFGQGVDTSMQDLLGGTTGQVLSKTSGTNMDFTWINNDTGDITGVTAGTGITGGGTSGTVTVTNDMATTITTAGDLIKGTGSGTYNRLGIGTTGQVLSVVSGAPAWSTVAASALALIQRTSFSNVATTTTSFDGCFTSTYTQYIIKIETLYAGTAADDLYLQYRYAGPTTQAADHYGSCNSSAANTSALTYIGSNGAAQMTIFPGIGSSGEPGAGHINVTKVGNSSETPVLYGQYSTTGGSAVSGFFGGVQVTARTYTGFILSSSSSNITGTVSVYGMAKS